MSTPLYLSIPLTLVSVLGLLFNGYIITAVLLTRQATTANNILLLHLGIVDILLGLLFLILSIPGINKNDSWLMDGFPCIIHGFLFTLLNPIALWTICGLNCDRYYAIAAPLHYSHIVNQKKILIGLGIGWFITLILCIPPLLSIAPYNYINELGACIPNFSIGIGTLWYSTLYTAFTLLLPATIIICCNFKILMIARYHRHRIASAIYEVTLSAQVTITHQRNPFFVPTITAPSNGGPSKFRGRNAINTIFQLVGSLILFYLPFYCLIIWQATIQTNINNNKSKLSPPFYYYKIVIILLIFTPLINGFLYGIKCKLLRKTFQNYLRKKQTKNEVNQEIQARTPSTCGSRRPSLTPLGLLMKPTTLQRRLSETLFDFNNKINNPTTTTKSEEKIQMKFVTTTNQEINNIQTTPKWRRPFSTTNLTNLLTPTKSNEITSTSRNNKIKHSTSCNTLQVPINNTEQILTITEDELLKKIHEKNQLSLATTTDKTTNRFKLIRKQIQKLFHNSNINNKNEKCLEIVDRSPTITITHVLTNNDDNADDDDKDMNIRKQLSSTSSSLSSSFNENNWQHLLNDNNLSIEQLTNDEIIIINNDIKLDDNNEVINENQLLLWNDEKKIKIEDIRNIKK